MGWGKGASRARRSWLRWLVLGAAVLAGATSVAAAERPGQAGARGTSTHAVDAGARGTSTRPADWALPAGMGLHVVPFPGTPDASPRSPVIFSSLSPAEVRSVRVTGSRSGRHRGAVQELPAGAGTAFVPRTPFMPGERVTVIARLRSRSAGTASGEPGATRLRFSFGVSIPAAGGTSHPATVPGHLAAQRHQLVARTATGPAARSFRSEPGLSPPAVSVSTGPDPDTHSGDMFLSPGRFHGGGLMILNPFGQLVWFDSVAPKGSFNLAVQSYQGRPVLTWYQGPPGEDVIANRSYQTVAVVKAADGYNTNLHEFLITPQGTAWLEGTKTVQADLSSVGGPSDGELVDYVIQKVDIKTGQLLWQWGSYGHIPLNASYMRLPASGHPWDAFHLNSIQVLPDGNLLVSARHTWSVYKISTKTGAVLWTLGGKYNEFTRGPGTEFEWQHDARRIGHTLTVFDDGAGPHKQEEGQSSGKELAIQIGRKTVTLIQRFRHAPPLLTTAMGNMQSLPNGNSFIGWGTAPDFSEYTSTGKQIFNASFALGTNSYRAYRFPWSGRPATPPNMAVARASGGRTNVWASWNGATNVSAWRVLGGLTPLTLQPLATHPDHRFETRIILSSQPIYVEVQALNAHGQVLPHGTSTVQAVN